MNNPLEKKTKLKVISYIFRDDENEILVFDHRGMPEAGTQVVGGTVESGEDFKAALAREILEESGLIINVDDMTPIGETTYHRKDKPEINQRHYFKIISHDLPASWSHTVKSDGEDNGLIFDFFWLTREEAKTKLTGNFGELL